MPIYETDQQLYGIMAKLFERLEQQSTSLDEFATSHLVIRICLQDPAAELLLDGRQPHVFYGRRPGRADLELSLPADLLHQIWTGQASLQASFFNGKIKTKGHVFQAMVLGDLFREAQRFYPSILQEEGL